MSGPLTILRSLKEAPHARQTDDEVTLQVLPRPRSSRLSAAAVALVSDESWSVLGRLDFAEILKPFPPFSYVLRSVAACWLLIQVHLKIEFYRLFN